MASKRVDESYAKKKKWRLAATVDSCKTNCQTTGTCSCSHFQLGLTKVVARLSARKKTCKWRDEQENSYVNWRTMVLRRRLMIRGFGTQAVVQSKRTNFPFYLFVSGCAQRQNITEKQHKASRNNTFYLLWAYSVYLLKGSYRTSAGLFGRKLRNRNTQWTLVLENIPVFLADPWTPAPTAPLPGLPGAPVFLLKRLLKKLASTPSLAAPAAE